MKKIIIVIIIIVLSIGAGYYWTSNSIKMFPTQAECEKETGKNCSNKALCDYKCPRGFHKGWWMPSEKPEKTLLPQKKEVYSWTATGEPSKFKYFCDSGFIELIESPPPGGTPYRCSDGSQMKSIRELTVKCKTGFIEYTPLSFLKSIPYKCDDNSELIVEKHSYPREETVLCQREGEEPYIERLYIKEPTEKRVCTSPGNPKFIEVIDIY